MPEHSEPVTIGMLIAVLGVLYTPMGVLSGYAVVQTWEARTMALKATEKAVSNENLVKRSLDESRAAVDKSVAALAAAGAARPDPFTGSQGRDLEARVTARQQEMAGRCEHNVERLDNEIRALEQRCIERLHQIKFGVFPPMPGGKK